MDRSQLSRVYDSSDRGYGRKKMFLNQCTIWCRKFVELIITSLLLVQFVNQHRNHGSWQQSETPCFSRCKPFVHDAFWTDLSRKVSWSWQRWSSKGRPFIVPFLWEIQPIPVKCPIRLHAYCYLSEIDSDLYIWYDRAGETQGSLNVDLWIARQC